MGNLLEKLFGGSILTERMHFESLEVTLDDAVVKIRMHFEPSTFGFPLNAPLLSTLNQYTPAGREMVRFEYEGKSTKYYDKALFHSLRDGDKVSLTCTALYCVFTNYLAPDFEKRKEIERKLIGLQSVVNVKKYTA